MVKREIRGRYLVAFLLTASVFVLGIFLGIIISDVKISKIYGYERELMINLVTQDVQSALLEGGTCKFVDNSVVSQELFKVGDRLDALEKELGKDDENVISLKNYYIILEVKDYLFFKKLNDECDGGYILNLFFYSNDPKKCGGCKDQGFVLSYARAKNEKIRTYSFDVDLELPVIQYLVDYYDIEGVPSVVFNGEVINGFVDAEKVDEIAEVLGHG